MRGRRLRIRAPRRPRIPLAAGIAPGPQHRSGDTEFPGNLAQRSATARQHPHRLSLKLIRELSTRRTHPTPFQLPQELIKGCPPFRGRVIQPSGRRSRTKVCKTLVFLDRRFTPPVQLVGSGGVQRRVAPAGQPVATQLPCYTSRPNIWPKSANASASVPSPC